MGEIYHGVVLFPIIVLIVVIGCTIGLISLAVTEKSQLNISVARNAVIILTVIVIMIVFFLHKLGEQFTYLTDTIKLMSENQLN